MLARHLRISGWESWRVQWLRRLVDFSPYFSIFPFVAHRPQLSSSLRGLSKLIHIDDRNLWSCGMQQGARRQTPADNSWLCLMSNWHYNGCPHSRWNSPSLPLTLCSECIEPAGSSKSRGHNWNASATSPPFALICLEPETMQPFCSVISWSFGRREKGDKRELLWLYEVIAIIVAHTLQTWINTITMQHLVWRRFPLPFLPAVVLKINAIYCCPFAKKERRKREKKSGKLHNRNACVINFKRNKKWSAKRII